MRIERRAQPDRRRAGLASLLFLQHRRRSSKGRRSTDRGGYVDVYDSKTWGVAGLIFSLSMLDAVLTGLQIQRGTVFEANPIMRSVLTHGGPFVFFSIKAGMTAVALAILVAHKEWNLAHLAARVCLWGYALVALYHLYLILIT